MTDSKTCKRCNQAVAISNFYKHATNKDGLMGVCKACHNSRCRDNERANKEGRARYWAKYYKANQIKMRERSRRYKHNNPEKVKAAYSAWRKQDPERDKKKHAARRSAMMGVRSFYVSSKELARLRAMPCFYCGANSPSHIDHVVPLSKGGNNSIGNYLPACKRCNSSKKDRFLTQWKKVRGW